MKKFLSLFLVLNIVSACGSKNKDYLVKIKTSYGDMTVLLYEETPLHKENFLSLAESGRYDSTIFHRVMENFMIQGGNVAQKEGEQEKPADRIPAEIVPGFYHTKGTLAAARQPDPVNPEKMSSSTQFYIVDGQPWNILSADTINVQLLYQKIGELLQDTANRELIEEYLPVYQSRDNSKIFEFALSKKQLIEEKFGVNLLKEVTNNDEAYEAAGGGAPHLDGEYTVFGRVVEGLEVIDKIAVVETTINPQTRQKTLPVDPIPITMEVIEMKKKEITEKYGYSYK